MPEPIMYGQVPLTPPNIDFDRESEAYAQTVEAETLPLSYEDDGKMPPVTKVTDGQLKKKRKPIAFPSVRFLSLGRGSLLKLSLLAEFVVYCMIWTVASLLKYEISEEAYKVIEVVTQPFSIWSVLMLLFVVNAARQSSAQDKFKATVVDLPRLADASTELESTCERQRSLSEQANTVLAIALSYLLIYIVVMA